MIHHLHYISNGVPTATRERGLEPRVFGPGKRGWAALKDSVCPMLEARAEQVDRPIDTAFWCIGGTEPADSLHAKPWIGDRPFDRAFKAQHEGQFTFHPFLDIDELVSFLAGCRHASRGGRNLAYVGRSESSTPDSVIAGLASIGLINVVIQDAEVLLPRAEQGRQRATYRARGAAWGYEAIPKYEASGLWTDSDSILCSRLDEWVAEQNKIRPFAPHPNISVHELTLAAVGTPVMLLDPTDNVALATQHAAKHEVFVNLLSAAWKSRPIPIHITAPAGTDAVSAPPNGGHA